MKQEGRLFFLILLSILIPLALSLDIINNKNDKIEYVGSVVEYFPELLLKLPKNKTEANNLQLDNLKRMNEYIANAKKINNDIKIIVFPEYSTIGATPVESRDDMFIFLEIVPNPMDFPNRVLNPCNNQDEFRESPILIEASCISKEQNIILVFDFGSYEPCDSKNDEGCPSDGRFQYNTQVAFDEEGNLVGRYRKNHLYFEPWFDEPEVVDIAYFKTSFGVTFGMIVCFDILFEYPTQDYLNLGIENILMSTWWNNVIPLETSIEIQQGYSRVYNLNLLASQNPSSALQSTGSSIMESGNALVSYFFPEYYPKSDILIASINSEESVVKRMITVSDVLDIKNERQDLSLITHRVLNSYPSINELLNDSQLIPFISWKRFNNTNDLQQSVTLNAVRSIRSKLTCNFTYSIKESQNDDVLEYIMIAINAPKIPNSLPAPTKICAVSVISKLLTKESIEKALIFNEMSIEGNFDSDYSVFPGILSINGTIPNGNQYQYTKNINSNNVLLETIVNEIPLINSFLLQITA